MSLFGGERGARPGMGVWTAFVVIAAGSTSVQAQDRVTVQREDMVKPVVVVGEILDYTGTSLTLRTANGTIQTIVAESVQGVETYYSPAHLEALAAFHRGETEPAIQHLKQAFITEPREWVKREMLSALTRCSLRQGDWLAAAQTFLDITRTDPLTRHWGVAPLVWAPTAIGTTLSAQARMWLTDEREAARLIAASWLLLDPVYGEPAQRELQKLNGSSNPRITALARAQLWRKKLATGEFSDVTLTSWQADFERLPEPLRAGPQYLLARAYARLGETRQATAELLWLPLVYSQNEPLSARALREAADGLVQAGLPREAITLYHELVHRYGWSSEAAEAKRALQELRQQVSRAPPE